MPRMSSRPGRAAIQLAPVIVVATLVGVAVGRASEERGRKHDRLSGPVALDGGAALGGLSAEIGSAFEAAHPAVRVTVGTSGDDRGIEAFCAGEVDIAAASRRLSPD